MKKIIQIVALLVVLMVPVILFSQPLPYDQSIGGGSGSNPVGGGAPIGEGILLLLSLGMGYGLKKFRELRKMA